MSLPAAEVSSSCFHCATTTWGDGCSFSEGWGTNGNSILLRLKIKGCSYLICSYLIYCLSFQIDSLLKYSWKSHKIRIKNFGHAHHLILISEQRITIDIGQKPQLYILKPSAHLSMYYHNEKIHWCWKLLLTPSTLIILFFFLVLLPETLVSSL